MFFCFFFLADVQSMIFRISHCLQTTSQSLVLTRDNGWSFLSAAVNTALVPLQPRVTCTLSDKWKRYFHWAALHPSIPFEATSLAEQSILRQQAAL